MNPVSRRRDTRIAVRLASPTARLAAERVIADASYVVVPDLAHADAVVVDDESVATNVPIRVLVVSAVPAWCERARRAVLAGRCAAAITDADLTLVPAAVTAGRAGLATLARPLLALAATVPVLAERQVGVLSALAAGASLPVVAARLEVSTATVKRELASLYEEIGVTTRVELVLAARRLGILDEQGQVTEAGAMP
ncbi:MAG TPA: LuxR C-terminal-related transcriptional regulator [Acidimicrobiales bacterium]